MKLTIEKRLASGKPLSNGGIGLWPPVTSLEGACIEGGRGLGRPGEPS